MTEETIVAPVATTEIPATEQTTEVVTTPAAEPSQTPEKDERDKAIARMERRINRKHAEAAAANERVKFLEERLAVSEAPKGEPAVEEAIQTKAVTLAQEMTRQQEIVKNIGGVLKAGKALEGFDDACNTVNEELPFYDRGRPTPFLSAILEFDAPAKLLKHLGDNPDLCAELADLTPTRQVRRLDAIEREMVDKAKPKVSSAPKPLEAIKGSASGGDLADDLSVEEWTKRRNKQLKTR